MFRSFVDVVSRLPTPATSTVGILSCLLCLSNAAFDIAFGDDSDLTNFVTRPEIKAPKFNVTVYDAERVDPGYWFIAPYANIVQAPHAPKYYQPCQSGPAIYDGNGDLVWSGACLVENQNTCDFRAYEFNGSFYLSAIRYKFGKTLPHWKGDGFVMDHTYRIIRTIKAPAVSEFLNMHEMKLIDNGNSVLYINSHPEKVDMTELGRENFTAGWLINTGFQEFDLVNNKTVFNWKPHPHVSILESDNNATGQTGKNTEYPWNWFHANSIDKNSDGDYIFCSRYTNCIYKISGRDGSIIWRFGGKRSDFELQGFNFSRQHDARWLEHNDQYEIISFLDNGGDELTKSSNATVGLTVYLDKQAKTARVLNRWYRPGDRQSLLRGNFQGLPSGNWFGAWSDNCHISEHTSDGRLLMEAEFQSDRFVTYRAWKHNFTSMPEETPVMKAFAYGTDAQTSVVLYYISWNGATEVASWNFYREGDQGATLIGNTKRTGFETRFQSNGYVQEQVFAEAVDSNGAAIGRSLSIDVEDFIAWGETRTAQPQEQDSDEILAKHTEL